MTLITPELLAEQIAARAKDFRDLKERYGGKYYGGYDTADAELDEQAATALPALARRVEELETHLQTAASDIAIHQARATAAEQQRDEAVKALEAAFEPMKSLVGMVLRLHPTLPDRDLLLAADAMHKWWDTARASLASLTPKEPT